MEQNKTQGDALNTKVDENKEKNSHSATSNPFLSFSLFLKNNILLILGFTLVGAGLGWYLGKGDSSAHVATMLVEPNFNSTAQLTAQVAYYQSLVEQNDASKLGKELGVTSSMATSIAAIQIEPHKDKIALLNEYKKVIDEEKGAAQQAFSFEAYQAAKKDTDYSYQVITATGSNPIALNKLMDKLIALEPTTGITAAKTATIDASWYKLTTLDNHTRNIDSLIVTIRKNISTLGQSQEGILETLFKEKQHLASQVNSIRNDWNKYQNTINVISRYTKQGVKAQNNLIVKGALLFFLLGLFVSGLRVLWKNLKEYESR